MLSNALNPAVEKALLMAAKLASHALKAHRFSRVDAARLYAHTMLVCSRQKPPVLDHRIECVLQLNMRILLPLFLSQLDGGLRRYGRVPSICLMIRFCFPPPEN